MVDAMRRFGLNADGAAAIIFVVALLPLLLVIGAAIDYSRWTSQRATLQSIADSSALVAANLRNAGATAEEKRAIALNFFNAQLTNSGLAGARATVTVNGDEIAVAATMQSPAYVGSMLRKDGATIGVRARATAAAATTDKARVLDVAMCVDATSSMATTIDAVRTAAGTFYRDMNAALKARGLSPYDSMRLRLLAFRDFSYAEGESYMGFPQAVAPGLTEYAFLTMPADAVVFQGQLDATRPLSGGDTPESAMECLNAAMTSPWLRIGGVEPSSGKTIGDATPLIVTWSDTYAQPIPDTPRTSYSDWRKGNTARSYPPPDVMPRTMTDFLAKWRNPTVIDQERKMYVVFGVCQKDAIMHAISSSGMPYSYPVQDGAWHFYDIINKLDRASCGGTLAEGNDAMVAKIADAMKAMGATAAAPSQLRLVE